MLPDPIAFSSAMRAMGLGDGMRVVVYDSYGLFSAPRVWWTLRTFGVTDVFVLDGGLPAWKAEGRPLEEGPVRKQPRHFTARLDHGAVASIDDVKKALATGAQVVDARAADRFRGEAPEPRPGLKSGHMPGAKNLPWDQIIEGGRLKPPAALAAAFKNAGVDLTKPVLTTCGSGVSAAILSLALETAANRSAPVYDGSWAEWGRRIGPVQDERPGHAPRTRQPQRVGVRPAGIRECAPQLGQVADQNEIDGISRQAVARDREARHMSSIQDSQPQPYGARQDHVGGKAICSGHGQRRRQALVRKIENHEHDEPDCRRAESEDQQTLQEKLEPSHADTSERAGCRWRAEPAPRRSLLRADIAREPPIPALRRSHNFSAFPGRILNTRALPASSVSVSASP